MIYPYRRLIKPRPGTALNKSHRLSKGLVGCWLMNEGGGNIIYDLVNKRNLTGAGTVGLPTWSTGKHGPALSYTAASEQYHKLDTIVPVAAYPFSVVAWFNSDKLSGPQTLFGFCDKDVTNVHQLLFIGYPNDGNVSANSSNTTSYRAIATANYTINTWNMAGGVWYSKALRAAFLNGDKKGTNTTSSDFSADYDRISIGRLDSSTPGWYMSGKIGLVMLWKRALADSEMGRLYREPFCMFEPAIINPALFYLNLFPTLDRSPDVEGFVDQYSDETVSIASYSSGYPLIAENFTFDPKNFAFHLSCVSNSDKQLVEQYYSANRGRRIFWRNPQNDTIYKVIFTGKPSCQLNKVNNLWSININFRQEGIFNY